MSVVESMTMTAPEPSIDPAAPACGPSNGTSSWSAVNHGAEPPPGTNALRSLPVADALAELVAVEQVAEGRLSR